MLVVIATVPGKPEVREQLRSALAQAAAASRGDAGCLSYGFYSDVEDQNAFVSVETWQDRASLDAHMQQPHTQALLAAAAELLAGAPTITVHEVSASERTL